MRGGHAEFDDVALPRRTDEIDLGHELGHDALIVELADGVNRGFFVDPAQKAAAEQRAVGVQIFGLDPLSGVETA
jgi:hypothetical protein